MVVGTYQGDTLLAASTRLVTHLTQVGEVHRILEEGGKVRLAGIRGDGNQEVHLAFPVVRMAPGVSRTQGDLLSEEKEVVE